MGYALLHLQKQAFLPLFIAGLLVLHTKEGNQLALSLLTLATLLGSTAALHTWKNNVCCVDCTKTLSLVERFQVICADENIFPLASG